jgi:hypothetical protein
MDTNSAFRARCLGWLLAGAAGLLPLAGHATPAQLDGIFVCVDADGHKTYQNSAEGTGCRRVDGIVATIPSTELARNQAPRPSRPTISPASFPRVDVGTQRVRDGDRRRILQEELRTEETHLAHLRLEFNQGQPQPAGDESVGTPRYREHVQHLFEDIERSEGNIASLRRELTPVRY